MDISKFLWNIKWPVSHDRRSTVRHRFIATPPERHHAPIFNYFLKRLELKLTFYGEDSQSGRYYFLLTGCVPARRGQAAPVWRSLEPIISRFSRRLGNGTIKTNWNTLSKSFLSTRASEVISESVAPQDCCLFGFHSTVGTAEKRQSGVQGKHTFGFNPIILFSSWRRKMIIMTKAKGRQKSRPQSQTHCVATVIPPEWRFPMLL